jgi:hypothetical protein
MPAIPSQLLTKMVQQGAHNASGMLHQLYDLLDTIDVVALSGLETFDQSIFQDERISRACLNSIALPQARDLESQITLFLKKGECFDDPAPRGLEFACDLS